MSAHMQNTNSLFNTVRLMHLICLEEFKIMHKGIYGNKTKSSPKRKKIPLAVNKRVSIIIVLVEPPSRYLRERILFLKNLLILNVH